MASKQADRSEVRTETEARSGADDIAKAQEEREHEHEHEHKHKQKNDSSIIHSIIGAVKSTLGNAENAAAEKTSNPEERLEETTEAGENEDDENEDYNTVQFACT